MLVVPHIGQFLALGPFGGIPYAVFGWGGLETEARGFAEVPAAVEGTMVGFCGDGRDAVFFDYGQAGDADGAEGGGAGTFTFGGGIGGVSGEVGRSRHC